MAILGKLIERQLVSRAGDDLSGVTLATLAHSLETNPETVLVQHRSIQEVGHQPNPQLLGVGGNASIATIGYAVPSTASCPTVYFEALAIYWHSTVR